MANTYDLLIRNGKLATAEGTRDADLAVRDGRIAAIAPGLCGARREIDATGKLVVPGGIDSHTHIEQVSAFGIMCADDFHSATVSAAHGGTTTTISFAAQHRDMLIPEVLADYHRRAAEKAVIDYAFHLIVANPTGDTLDEDLPRAIAHGLRSFKLYMTYERLRLSDEQILDVLSVARAHGALTMVHAENHGMIGWLAGKMAGAGNVLPRYHAICHTRGAEAEAINRIIALAELVDAPVLVVHVSTVEGIDTIRKARARGLKVFGETCPQYLFLTAKDLDRGGLDGAMFCCSPPPRDEAAQQACWAGISDGTLEMYSSDHAPYRFDASGKLPKGEKTTFKDVANGVPGLELRLPLLFSEGVATGRISLEEFVKLSSTNHARTYGLYPRKGELAVGSDADIAIWDPAVKRTATASMLHDAVGYTPYEGRSISGWPVTVISRGDVIVHEGELHAERGRGRYLAREAADSARPAGLHVPEVSQLDAWDTPLSR
ncbi:MAG: dihydropyrimidinase [Burkholderiaceae bacterium]|nr:dihydropyrimidinase [Burkholderiaceae bacterium]